MDNNDVDYRSLDSLNKQMSEKEKHIDRLNDNDETSLSKLLKVILEDLRVKHAKLSDLYDDLILENGTLKLKVKMLEIKNRNLKAKLNNLGNQDLVYDGLGDK